jgi:hypothetical protein
MAIIAKRPDLIRNSIPQQVKVSANSLTIQEWNTTVNALASQSNKTTKYVEDLHRMLFHDYDMHTQGYLEFPSGFVEYAHLNIEGILADAHVLSNRVTALEVSMLDHTSMSLESRSAPNQHPIQAITNLGFEIGVHVGATAPTEYVRTWLEDVEFKPHIDSNWQILESNSTISDYAVLPINTSRDPHEPLRMLVLGDWFGEIYMQELNNDQLSFVDPTITMFSGELLLSTKYINGEAETQIVYVEIDIDYDWYFVRVFENRGTVNITSFESFRIEVFR